MTLFSFVSWYQHFVKCIAFIFRIGSEFEDVGIFSSEMLVTTHQTAQYHKLKDKDMHRLWYNGYE
jgi:hypothetical protein